mgnify:CR=1 FL=1
MVIRPLTPADAHSYMALRREMLGDSPWAFSASPHDDTVLNPALLTTRLAEPGQAIVGAYGHDPMSGALHLVGAAGLRRNHSSKMAHRAHIWGVYVTPSARGRGIATQVMKAILALAGTWPGVNSVNLSGSVRSTAAHRLYERMGFQQWGLEPGAIMLDGHAYDEIHMVAPITGDGHPA